MLHLNPLAALPQVVASQSRCSDPNDRDRDRAGRTKARPAHPDHNYRMQAGTGARWAGDYSCSVSDDVMIDSFEIAAIVALLQP